MDTSIAGTPPPTTTATPGQVIAELEADLAHEQAAGATLRAFRATVERLTDTAEADIHDGGFAPDVLNELTAALRAALGGVA